MIRKFLIHYCQGGGGQFLASVFAKILGIKAKTKISSLGDCHDVGNGIWKSTEEIFINHVFDITTGQTRLQHIPGAQVYISHDMTKEFIEQHPDIELVQITADINDYINMANLAVKKAWPIFWTKAEYDKWVSPEYPPYSPTNILESDLICNDLINHVTLKQTLDWYEKYKDIKYSYQIDFKTIMGINNKNIANEVKDITNGIITNDIIRFISNYQTLNKKLYFKIL